LVFLGVVAVTTPASVALGAGPGAPIFVRVPTRPGAAPLSLDSAIRRQLARATDPFTYEDAAARLTATLASLHGRANGWSRLIRHLHNALQPVVLPRPAAPGGTATGWNAVAVAEHYLGVRYLWGGSDPRSGFDCSGFVKFVYAQLGVDLPHYAA